MRVKTQNRIVCNCVASATVNEHVPLQITSSAKGLSALLTVVYFLPTVGDHVPPQDLWHWTQAYVFSLLCVNM